ncbi:MAG: hypothetical protein HC828_07255, partial [Blastochloris sp.]|nr:hypothetical protein [Blastochloris sp.]
MGRLEVHDAQPAHTDRYLTTPLLTLHDVGAYMLCLGGWTVRTPALERLGFIRDGRAHPLPADGQLLALASQQALDQANATDIELTAKGLRKLGVAPAEPRADPPSGATLFFVAPGVIGHVIDSLIDTPITNPTTDDGALSAAECGEMASTDCIATMPGNPRNTGSSGTNYPPTPQRRGKRGGSAQGV